MRLAKIWDKVTIINIQIYNKNVNEKLLFSIFSYFAIPFVK